MNIKNPLPAAGGLIYPVVGVGASAGGLAALNKLFESVPGRPGMAFVVLHLSPWRTHGRAAC